MSSALVVLALVLGAPPAPVATALKAAPKGLQVQGRFHAGLRFKDVDGEHVLVLSTKDAPGARHLFAVLAKETKGRFEVQRTVKDWEQDCEFDLMVGFHDDATQVSDADGDGRAEVTFAYELGCVSDVSPVGLKLMLLEGPDKYAVRGQTRVRVSETEWMGGERTLDPALDAVPKLKALAAARWTALITRGE
ncbi:MAG: hypothetical protein KC933_18675 [Myxococcales bacterium]|nr:hypothetical protein [Myxococcales bacterium]MCB9645022.1 hypothetical protein [Deltaproteobacteria bacterium]